MNTTTPLHARLLRIIAKELKKLGKPMRALLTALYALFAPPPGPAQTPRPPVQTLPPTLGQTQPPGEPETMSTPRPGTGVTDGDEHSIRTVLGTDIKTEQAVTVSLKELLMGLYGIGVTGSGKSTLDLNMINDFVQQGLGLLVIEPHGDLTRAVIAAMPEERLNDVIYLDLTDSTSCSFGINFFECPAGADDTEVAKVASFVMHVFEKVWQVGPETPRLAQVLRNTTRVLIENPGMTFAEIPLLLWEDGVREKLVRRVRNTQTKLFWSQYNRKQPRDRDELVSSTLNKCDAYLNEPIIARIVSQSASTIDFRRIMDEGKILLVNLSPQLEEASRLIGAVLIGRLLMAAFSRADTPEDKRRPFLLYADEFQRYATADFATFLAEARKFKIGTTISNQVLEQLDDLNRATALQAGTLVVFRVSGEDSKALAPSFDATPTLQLVGEEPIRAVVADPVSHLTRHGHPHPTVAKFIADFLLPLAALIRTTGNSTFPVQLGCAVVRPAQVIEGQRQLSESFAACMRERRADVVLSPWALFVVGGAGDPDATYAFFKDLRHELGYLPVIGFEPAATRYGGPSFDTTREKDMAFLRAGVKTSIFELSATRARRVSAFIRMHKAIRQTLAILAKEPIMTETGLFQPKYQLRTYQDQENLVGNELSQHPNFHAKVRLLTGEHTIKTRPAPSLVSEREVDARIRTIKQRMMLHGYTKAAAEVEGEVAKRHEVLRRRPGGDEPKQPNHPNGNKRGRTKLPPDFD